MKELFVIFLGVFFLATVFQVNGQRALTRKLGGLAGRSDSSSECPAFSCWKTCSQGYMVNDKGCKLCACAGTKPKGPCPEIECPNRVKCPGGYRVDENGCTLCECICPLHGCRMYCEFGYEKDESGCTLCKCNASPVCESIRCDKECPEGLAKDRVGCEVCRCKGAAFRRRSCSRSARSCLNECAFGRALDRRGCPTCTCNPYPVASNKEECGDIRAMCAMYCLQGFAKDPKTGCEVCGCV